MLHLEEQYDFTVRTGGAQAEHRFKHNGEQYRMRIVPSAVAIDNELDVIIAAGAVVRMDILKAEIERYEPSTVTIDHNTAIVSNNNRKESTHTASKGRGGYHLGISQTLAQKLKRDPLNMPIADSYSDELEEMGVMIGDTSRVIHDWLSWGDRGLLEASQGALLSLNVGYHPFVTSYDVTIPAAMSQVGIGIKDIGTTYMVCKSYPTRVAGDSGYAGGKEITFESIGRPTQYQSAEDNSPDGEERLFEWSWEDFEKALQLNTPDKIVFSLTDWLTKAQTDEMIVGMESFGAEVGFIRYGEEVCDYKRMGGSSRISYQTAP